MLALPLRPTSLLSPTYCRLRYGNVPDVIGEILGQFSVVSKLCQ